MGGISISLTELFIKGVPEDIIIITSIHLFTKTKIKIKKYLLLLFIHVLIVYFIRFLPIVIGINALLSNITMILLFQMFYKTELAKVKKLIFTTIFLMVLLIVSELLNVLFLDLLFGEIKTTEFLNFSPPIIKSIYTMPSTILFIILVFSSYLIFININKNKEGCTK